jgi:hypothetical protein
VDRTRRLIAPAMRAASAAFFVLLFVSLAGEASAQRLTLDIAQSVARGEPRLAATLRTALPQEIRKQLAGKYSGPLRVRITDAKLMREPGFGIATRADYLEGVVIAPGRDPRPIRLTLPFDRSLFYFSPQGEALRARNLIEVFAQWVAKYS